VDETVDASRTEHICICERCLGSK